MYGISCTCKFLNSIYPIHKINIRIIKFFHWSRSRMCIHLWYEIHT